MNTSPVIKAQAVAAIVLTVVFYVTAIGLALVLLAVPVLEWREAHTLHLKLLLFCLVGAYALITAVIPRRTPFEAPGPRITPGTDPDLLREIHGVARATGQRMPDEIYLLPDVNAWVADVGRKRVLAVGLPLMSVLSVQELRAVIAHEFGHYAGGDTRLGSLLYRGRQSMIRAAHELKESGSVLHYPFRWYALAYLRLTHAMSRQQEFAADRVAAHLAGQGAAVNALNTVERSGLAFGRYWASEAGPVVGQGFLPPVMEGFRTFMCAPNVQNFLNHVTDQTRDNKAGAYDTHPPMPVRVKAIQALPATTAHLKEDTRSALSLLRSPAASEAALLGDMLDSRVLEPVSWDDVAARVWLPLWQEEVQGVRAALGRLTPAQLPALLAAPDARQHLIFDLAADVEKDAAEAVLLRRLSVALSLLLVAQGYEVQTAPGEPLLFRQGDHTVNAFELIGALSPSDDRAGATSTYHDFLTRSGVAALPLDSGITGSVAPRAVGRA